MAVEAAKFNDIEIVKHGDVAPREAFPNLTRRVLAHNEQLMLTEHVMEAGSVFPLHSHPEVQLAYLVSGHIRITCDGQQFEALAGDSFVIRGGVEHQVVALERSVALDVFTPCRADYREWSGGR